MPDRLPDFRDWSFLAHGSKDQRRAFATLSRHQPFDRLEGADSVLVGTFPIDIAIDGSDLDILVAAVPTSFASVLDAGFGQEAGYTRRLTQTTDGPALVVAFTLDGLPVEIFVQNVPVERQMGWRHMLVEARLLLLDPSLHPAIRALKQAGVKTEPAFARLLGLPGDPYQSLLTLEAHNDTALIQLLSQRRSAMPKQG